MNIKEYLESKQRENAQSQARDNRPSYSGSTFGGNGEVKTAGQIFTTSEAYKKFLENGQNSSDNVLVPAFTKALVTSVDTGGGLMGGNRIIGAGQPEMRLRDLLAVAPTDSNAVTYIRETGFVNRSAVAPEGTVKPESDLTFDEVTSLVKTIAHHIPATRQVIADVPQMRQFIDQRLMYGLSTTEESQVLFGSGVGDNIEGLMTVAGTQTYTGPAGETRLDSIRRALTMTYISGFPPTGIVVNPTDWQEIELLKGTDGHYVYLNIPQGNEMRVFRVPVVQSVSMTAGSFLVGAFGLGAQIFDREIANVRVAETHADDFVRNQLRILAEERIALAIYRPESFVRGTFATA